MPQTKLHSNEETRHLLVLRAGGRLFGVNAEALAYGSDSDVGFTAPVLTPLPGAPPSVRGVAQVRGRLYTVIDPAQMLATNGDNAMHDAVMPSLIVPLRGTEQLALAVEGIEQTMNLVAASIEPLDAEMPAVQGVARGIAEQDILVLDTGELFAAATQGMERRRRRS